MACLRARPRPLPSSSLARPSLFTAEIGYFRPSGTLEPLILQHRDTKTPCGGDPLPRQVPDSSLADPSLQLKLNQIELARPRQWGACWLALQLWDRLELDRFWEPRIGPSRKETPWLKVLKTLVVYRLIALIVTPDGLPIGYEVMRGNTSDKTTLRGMLKKISCQYGKERRTWIMDRGIPTEEALQEMRAADPEISYLVTLHLPAAKKSKESKKSRGSEESEGTKEPDAFRFTLDRKKLKEVAYEKASPYCAATSPEKTPPSSGKTT